jgi:hypothetical protein
MFTFKNIFRRLPVWYYSCGIGVTVFTVAYLLVGVTGPAAEQRYPDVLAVKARAADGDRFDFFVTVSSPYDSPERYADAFRVLGKDGTVYGERKLLHDHADEQPFTRELFNVEIPAGIKTIIVQARDQVYGFGGKTVEVALPGR